MVPYLADKNQPVVGNVRLQLFYSIFKPLGSAVAVSDYVTWLSFLPDNLTLPLLNSHSVSIPDAGSIEG